jgi:hypothetical protein
MLQFQGTLSAAMGQAQGWPGGMLGTAVQSITLNVLRQYYCYVNRKAV